jgi:tetratricopeptide (TPR) repeat protein
MSLKEALGLIYEKLNASNIELPIIVDTEAFKELAPEAPDVYETRVQFPPFPRKMSIKVALKLALSKVATGNATFMIRRDFIEITTVDRAVADKALRVYPVGDLVLPVNARGNPYASGAFGGLGGAFGGGFPGGFPGGGFPGGGFGFPGGGFPGGGFPGGGFPGGGFGFPGGGQNIPGQNCLGFNQFNGGLGAFGTGGLDQGLILLIRQVVAPGQWDVLNCQLQTSQFPGFPGFPGGGPGQGGLPGFPQIPGTATPDPADQAKVNHIAFYPSALALVVQGTAIKHYKYGGGIFGGPRKAKEAAASFQDMKDKPGVIVIGPKPKEGDVDVAGGKRKDSGPKLDATKIWQDALTKGIENPGLIVAAADLLFQEEKYDHAVELLKATLRQGIIVEQWVYEALAVALEFEGANQEEIRRASLSAISLNPKDAKGYVKAAQAFGEHQLYDKALAFCQQAAALEPGLPTAYADALVYAEKAKDAKAMQWAAGKVLSQDWTGDYQFLHAKAKKEVNSLVEALQKAKRGDEAKKLQTSLQMLQERDLTIILSWQPGPSGNADLELEIQEPTGCICSSQHRQSPGGGAMTGLNLDTPNKGTYTACQAFSGDYLITVKRLWGQPAGGKFRLEIIYHEGTAKKRHRIETLVLDQTETLKITLENGRRTELAQVTPTLANLRPQPKDEEVKGNNILTKLRDMSDSVHSQLPRGIKVGSAKTKSSAPIVPTLPTAKKQQEQMLYQDGASSSASGGVFVTTQAHLSADGQFVRVSVNPVFQSSAIAKGRPQLDMPLIPGGGQ